MRKKSYPSDLSREQFQQILPLLESVRKRTKPRTVDPGHHHHAHHHLARIERHAGLPARHGRAFNADELAGIDLEEMPVFDGLQVVSSFFRTFDLT
jgi:hypothetical protein